jgi:hypothetical protein
MNLYVMDVGQGEGQRAVGWSPTREGDFHVPARFGRVTFQAPVVAAAAEPGAAVAVPQLRIPPEIARRLRPDPQALRPGMRFPEVDVEHAPPQ